MGRPTGQLPRALRRHGKNRQYSASKLWIAKAKEFFFFFSPENCPHLLRQLRPKRIKFKEYQFQGAKLVASPGR